MSFFLYRFLNKNNTIIYVGKTKRKLQIRMSEHFGKDGHLPPECYEETVKIDFLELNTKGDMDIKELYYISKYKPKYNTVNVNDITFELDESKDVWENISDNSETETKDTTNKSFKKEIRELKKANSSLKIREEQYKQSIKYLKESIKVLKNKIESTKYLDEYLDRKIFDLKRRETFFITLKDFKESTVPLEIAYELVKNNSELAFVGTKKGKLNIILFNHCNEIIIRSSTEGSKFRAILGDYEDYTIKNEDELSDFKDIEKLYMASVAATRDMFD